jgi:hypothetical protein
MYFIFHECKQAFFKTNTEIIFTNTLNINKYKDMNTSLSIYSLGRKKQ